MQRTAATKGLSRYDVQRHVRREYQRMHDSFWNELRWILSNRPLWIVEELLVTYSQMFDEWASELTSTGMWLGEDDIPPYKQEQMLKEWDGVLTGILEIERKR